MKRSVIEVLDSIASNAVNNKYIHYSKKPYPYEYDKDFDDLIALFIESSAADRDVIVRSINNQVGDALLAYSNRMAVWGARKCLTTMIVNGGIALILEAGRTDQRDTIAMIALLYHSAVKTNEDPEKMFKEAARYYRSVISDALLDFLKRKPSERSLEAWGFEEVNGPDGVYYR